MKKTLLIILFFAINSLSYSQLVLNPPNSTLEGFNFLPISSSGELEGTLTEVAISATLTASFDLTFANDLTLYITANNNITSTGILQVGGFTDIGAIERSVWPCGASCDSDATGTIVSGSVVLNTPLDFTNNTYAIWLGNGFTNNNLDFPNTGTWENITLSLTGLSIVTASATGFNSNSVTLYPNPAINTLFIEGLAGYTLERISVTDINGRVVLNSLVTENLTSIDVSGLSKGVYFINIESNDGLVTKKFIKN